MLRRLVLSLLVGVLALGSAVTPAFASGSADLFPLVGADPACSTAVPDVRCRAAIEWRTNAYGPVGDTRIQRRTLFSVFAHAGEQILTGSSSIGTGAADIAIWNPHEIDDAEAAVLPAVVDGTNGFLCSAHRATPSVTGLISTRAQELARARSVDGSANTTGYVPCVYVAPADGLYRIAFYGSAGPDATADGTPDSALDPGTFRANAGTSVNAWDITLRAAGDLSGTSSIPGRVFTYVLAAFTGGNPRPVSLSMYLNTLDGYRYLVNTNGFDPNGFVFYGNREGFLDADGVTPLNHDVVGVGAAPQQLPALAGGVHLAGPQYPLSFEPLAPETLTALGIPINPVKPVLSAVDFAGRATARGSYVSQGGTFTLDAATGGTYEIVISQDDESSDPTVYDPARYDPGLPTNRVLRGVVGAGVTTVVWDGEDNAGAPFPVRDNYKVKAVLRAGEYHAPMLDVESSTRGGPSITLVNPPNDVCPFTRVLSTGSNCTRVFYDDRSYTSSSGVLVGDAVSGLLCPSFVGAVPATPFADPQDGIDSASTARAFGDGLGANANSQCSATAGTLGDSKGLDVWTYFPSEQFETSLDVLPKPAAPVAVDDSGTTTVDTPLVVPAVGILGNDLGTRLTVRTTVTTAPTHGVVTLGADGSYTYSPAAGYLGTDSFVYTISDDAGQTASATVHLTVTPRAVDDAWTTTVNTPLTVAGPGVLTNDAGTPLVAVPLAPPSHGTVTLRPDGSFDYVPSHDFSGVDTFTYRAGSGGLSSPPATVTITVTPTAADDDAGTIPPNATHVVAGPGVLTNDHGTALTVTGVGTPPVHGSVVIDPDGGYRYTPTPGWGGTDTFTYDATDGSGQPVSARVTLRVSAPVQLAAAIDDWADGVPDEPVMLPELDNDEPGDHLTFDLGTVRLIDPVSSALVGTVTVAHEGTWLVTPSGVRFSPVAGFQGAVHMRYSVSNSAGQNVSARLTVRYPAAPVVAAPTLLVPTPATVVPVSTPAVVESPPVTAAPSLAHTGSDPAGGLALAVTMLSVGFAFVVARRRLAR